MHSDSALDQGGMAMHDTWNIGYSWIQESGVQEAQYIFYHQVRLLPILVLEGKRVAFVSVW